jgi:diguanylate cyclase (GGDEF)-like protein
VVARFRKTEHPVSVLILDVDHLRGYHEHYGPAAGDAILKFIGRVLDKQVREEDLISRFGGEEFLVGMGCRPVEALKAAQRLASLVKKNPVLFNGTEMRISVTIGVSGYPDHGATPRKLVQAARTALEQAKHRGRGLCLVFDPAMAGRTREHPDDTW